MEDTKQGKGKNSEGGRSHRTPSGRSMPRSTRVKNKAAAPIQITAEQLLREAQERQDAEFKPPKMTITDPDELEEYRYRKRRAFEDTLRRSKANIGTWLKYAAWEESQNELERARSIYERCLDVDYKIPVIWLKYAEMEMKHKNINAARNLWDRAVTLLPRVDQFWLKYSYMEDILGNYAGARQVFERWMEWEPEERAWNAYIRFEMRNSEYERARSIYERFVRVHPSVRSWMKWAKFEEKHGDRTKARSVYEKAVEVLGEDANDEKLFIAFGRFEERCREIERARAIYKYALDHIPKKEAEELYKMWIAFEKKFGDKDGIEEVIVGKRRFQYEEEIKTNPSNYDVWFDYARLEETYGEIAKAREVYERAISQMPPANEKKYWRRYIYLWINYALFEELEAQDIERTREVYKECLKQIPHKIFTFAKIWVMFAKFEVRQKNLQGARQIFGNAIGMAPKDKIFKEYIQLELQIGNVERCRIIYEKWLEWAPGNSNAWIAYAHLERDLGEIDRARAIFELSISQPVLSVPEIVWKAYIDFEIDQEDYDRVRALYRRLLERTKHVKVWISFAQFESSVGNLSGVRAIYGEAYEVLKGQPDERVTLVETWKDWELAVGDPHFIQEVEKKQPKKVIKKRPIQTPEGVDAGMEEYFHYIFPGDEQAAIGGLKILERAKMWKKQEATEDQ